MHRRRGTWGRRWSSATSLFVLVEERGQVRLDVLDAAARHREVVAAPRRSRRASSRPRIPNPSRAAWRASRRRSARACSSVRSGAARSWRSTWRPARSSGRTATGSRMPRPPTAGRLRSAADERAAASRSPAAIRAPSSRRAGCCWRPYDADELICLGLRDGAPAWPEPLRGRLQIGRRRRWPRRRRGPRRHRGARDRHRPAALAAATSGGRAPQRPRDPHGGEPVPSLDTPEVVEIAVADGGVVGRRAARGGAVPGNLVAYRGEVISQGSGCGGRVSSAGRPRVEDRDGGPDRVADVPGRITGAGNSSSMTAPSTRGSRGCNAWRACRPHGCRQPRSPTRSCSACGGIFRLPPRGGGSGRTPPRRPHPRPR